MTAVNNANTYRRNLEEHNKYNSWLNKLVELAKLGNQNSYNLIIEEMNPYNKYLAKKFTNRVIEIEDLMQIANLGLFQGVQQFNYALSRNNVKGFLKKCMHREVIDYLNSLSTYKRKIINETVSSNTILYTSNEKDFTIADVLVDDAEFIEDIIEFKESEKYIEKLVATNLPERQKNVFLLRFNGYSYDEICSKLNLNKKQVDNAFQSAKKNLRNLYLQQAN